MVENKTIPDHDIFSFTMPEFKWINHEWLSDSILYIVEKNLGVFSLIVLYILLFAGIVFIISKSKNKFNPLDMMLALVGLIVLSSQFAGIRQQVYSFLFFSITLFVLSKKDKRLLWLLPLIFLFWTNLHGGFVLGIFILILFCAINYRTLLYPTIVSVLATFLNPYGLRIYEEVFRTIGDKYLATHIREWLPITHLFNNPRVVIFFIIFTFFLWLLIKNKKVAVEDKLICLFLFAISIKSLKYIPYFIIAALPPVFSITDEWTSAKIDTVRKILKKYSVAIGIIIFLVSFLFIFPNIIPSKNKFPDYPSKESLEYLKSDTNKIEIFNYYGWGGYLIRYASENKYFIDGRMPSWKTKEKYVFKDYIEASECRGTNEILEKYNANLVIWPVNKITKCNFLEELKKNEWKEVFNDVNTVILKKDNVL